MTGRAPYDIWQKILVSVLAVVQCPFLALIAAKDCPLAGGNLEIPSAYLKWPNFGASQSRLGIWGGDLAECLRFATRHMIFPAKIADNVMAGVQGLFIANSG